MAARPKMQRMDEVSAITIPMTESRRKVACSMLAAHGAGQLPLSPDEVSHWRAEIDECDAELAQRRDA
jgi:hypothetical protein